MKTFLSFSRGRNLFGLLFWLAALQLGWAQNDLITVQTNSSDYYLCIAYWVDQSGCNYQYTSADINITEFSDPANAGQYILSFNTVYLEGNVCSEQYPSNVEFGPGHNSTAFGWVRHISPTCNTIGNVSTLTLTTDPLYAPLNVQASDGIYDTEVTITWQKGTDLPMDKHGYQVKRNGQIIATLPSTQLYFTDSNQLPGSQNYYIVQTVTTHFGTLYSAESGDYGSTFTPGLDATDGTHYGKTKLTWNDLSAIATDIRVERSIPGSTGREELIILNKHATSYTDTEGIPGYSYTYYVTPLAPTLNFQADADPGFSRPNGTISGHVKSKLGAGVDSVEIMVELLDNLPAGGNPQDSSCPNTYCAITDASGYYEIKDVYYYEEAEFRIHAEKGTHDFDPDTVKRLLSTNSPTAGFVDFTDLNVLTVSGRVTYPVGHGSTSACGVPGVTVLINGDDAGIRTGEDGIWNASLDNSGTYGFSARLHDHVYENEDGGTVTSLFIGGDRTGINFENKTTRSLNIVAQAGCYASLGDSVHIDISSDGNCFSQVYTLDHTGLITIEDLHPRDYKVEFVNVFGAGSNTSNIVNQLSVPVDINLVQLDTMVVVTEEDSIEIIPVRYDTLPDGSVSTTPADTNTIHYLDTTYTTDQAVRFIYRSPITISIDFNDAGAAIHDCGGQDVIVMDQKQPYTLEIIVKESVGNCYIDTGTLIIYDEISDKHGIGQRIPISQGIARYVVEPGDPDLAVSSTHNHEKFFYIIPQIDFAEVEPKDYWVLVTGIKSNAPSFITRTPEIPQLILHDPPGDNSFTTIEKGSTFTTSTATTIQVGGDAGVFANLKAGPIVKTFFGNAKVGGSIQLEVKAGRDNTDNFQTTNTITFLENYSTSSASNFVGEEGDVFIGSAMNQTYALSQELTFNASACQASIDTIVEMGYKDFATTFIYTEFHVLNSLLPSLKTLLALSDTTIQTGRMEYNRILADILLWQQIIDKNRADRDTNAVFKENLSFTAGATISKEHTSTTGIQNTYTYNSFFNSSLRIGIYAEMDVPLLYTSNEAGVMATFRYAHAEVRDTVNEDSRKVSYTLSDDDIGDFFSVDVYQDTAYDMPAFRIVSGVSSCPHEANTQERDKPAVGVFPPVINNVPPDQAANFVLSITNNSESGEARQYAVKLVSNANPDGAIVNVAGSDINSFPVTYYFDAGQTLDLSMTVYKGPLASNYDSIGIMIYPECEYNNWLTGSKLLGADTTWFSVNYLSECSNVSLHLPNQSWLVNQSSNNTLHTAFTGYDVNNPFLESVTLQIKRDGYGYQNQVTIPIEDLTGPFYDHFLDVSTFPDGNYTVRARANCGLNGGYTYSSEVSGIIDRTSLAPFGIPTPSDGFLREGQDVSVSFDKVINCQEVPSGMITLVREDTGEEIPFTASCFQNKIILNSNPPLIDQTDLDGVLVTATVEGMLDLNGNVQEYPTTWSFLVNVSPVFWDPEALHVTRNAGEPGEFTAILKNTSLLSKSFSLDVADAVIIDYPDWLTPINLQGTILPENDFIVHFDVVDHMTPGVYTGVITAMVDSLPVSMELTYELLAKPVNWTFDPNQYQHTMNIVVQFSLDNSNTNLSEDTRDIIGAFVNGQIRGVTNIIYLPELDVYRAFLTVYSNVQGGNNPEIIEFRFWHALNGVEYGAVETTQFVIDAVINSVASPLILHPQGFHQVIPLKKGWNWISLNVESSIMSRAKIFARIMNTPANNSIVVKSKSQTAQYEPHPGQGTYQWSGNLQTLNLGSAYLVYLSNAPDTLRIVGYPSDDPIVLPVTNGWNWIGFPRLQPETIEDVLDGLSLASGNLLKSQDKFAVYNATEQAWIGNLSHFSPGFGYKFKWEGTGNLIFDASRGYVYETDSTLYEYNMNVTGYADLDMIGERYEEDMIIGAFIDGVCRGTGRMEYMETIDEYRVFMLVNGNVTDLDKQIEFRFKNEKTGAEYVANGNPLTFVADGIFGWVSTPYPFFSLTTSVAEGSKDGYHMDQCQPNPTAGPTQFTFNIPQTERVTIQLYNIQGERVATLLDAVYDAGQHAVQSDLTTLQPGVYYYEMQTRHFSGSKKLVKQ